MLTRKKAIQITKDSEIFVYSKIEEIAQLIQLHASLGLDQMEVFIDKESSKKIKKVLDKNGYYSKITAYKVLEYEYRLYVSWMSNL